MRSYAWYGHGLLSALLLATSPALAISLPGGSASGGDEPADCARIMNLLRNDLAKEHQPDVRECVARGWDPSIDSRESKGKGAGNEVGGGGGYSPGTIRSPEQAPWKFNTNAGVGGGTYPGASSGINFPPPWGGSSGSSGSSSGSGGSGSSGGGACPTSNDDNEATYGAKGALTKPGMNLQCGGAAPMSTYQLSLVNNADSLLITEHGHYNYWIYKRQGDTYKLVSPANAALPKEMCDSAGSKVAIEPPIAQMISFNSSAPIAIRLRNGDTASDPLAPPTTPEKWVVTQANSGTLQFGGTCPSLSQYYKATAAIGSIVFDTVMSAGCEAPPATCSALGLPTNPSTLPDCRLSYSYPKGSSCTDKVQVALIDRPNLIYPSGANAPVYDVQGISTKMMTTVNGSTILTKDGSIVRFGDPNATFALPQGGTLGLSNGNRLVMNAPATISGSGKVTLTGGGYEQTASGSKTSEYKEGTSLTANATKPLVVKINQAVGISTGFIVPSAPAANVRLPITTKKE